MAFLIGPMTVQADSFQLVSSAFDNNSEIPKKYTCDGADINPPLTFKNVPPKAKTLVLTVSDPDAPEGTWSHWVVYNIPPEKPEIKENSIPGTEGLSDFGKYAYAGPCPQDNRLHHYIFRAYALKAILVINEGPSIAEVEKAIRPHTIAKAQLTATYQKSTF